MSSPEEKEAFISRYDPENRLGLMRENWEEVTDEAGKEPGRHPMSQEFVDFLHRCIELHDKKQADYGRDDDPFANVRGSVEWGINDWIGSMVRAQDKIRRLQKYARTGELANESVEDAFMDLVNYTGIAAVLWRRSRDDRG